MGVIEPFANRNPTLFDSQRMTLEEAIEMTAQSLRAYALRYQHWVVAFSGGKDSSAVVAVVFYLIISGRIPMPKSLTVLQSDTRMELPPLWESAVQIMQEVRTKGFVAQVVTPPMDDRFFVYMLGRGVPPPSNTFRWCTGKLKIDPMLAALKELRELRGEKFLMLTGVRVGESAARDARIAVSCGKNNTECGQGWFQEATQRIAMVYGQDEDLETHARTGCVGCNLTSQDFALNQIIARAQWKHYAPLLGLRPLYAELKKPGNRLRKDGSETRKDGSLVANPCRMGPITFAARMMGLAEVKRIQEAAGVDLINGPEESRILELIESRTWPRGWTGDEPLGSAPFENVFPDGSRQLNLT